jgi:hypothetical protein
MNPFVEKQELRLTEERKIYRVTFPRILDSVVDAFNLDRGLIYTLKRLFTVPGKLVSDYLYKGRYHYTPPFRMLLVSTTLVIVLIAYSKTGMNIFQMKPEGVSEDEGQLIGQLLQENYNLFLWLFIPILGLFSWLFNRSSKYNYAENLVFQTYLAVIGNILYIIMILDRWVPPSVLVTIYFAVSTGYIIISYHQFFKKAWWRSVMEAILIYVLGLIVYGILSAVIIGIFVGYSKAAGA